MASRMIFGGAAVTLYITMSLTAYRVQRIRNKPQPDSQVSDPAFQSIHFPLANKAFDTLSATYDDKIDTDEWLLGILSKRRKLLAHAKGRTLEVSAGTGRNLSYYPEQTSIDSLILSDCNLSMIQLSQQKYHANHTTSLPSTTFILQDASSLQFPSDTFDTIVDTFGLCSCVDPSLALAEMKRVVKPGGSILLLEHGRCEHAFVNEILDKGLEDHVKSWGCFWNRDIDKIVDGAGLEVVEKNKHHLGTMTYIVAKKREFE